MPQDLFATAAYALAKQVTPENLAQGLIYPPLENIRDVSARIAGEVADECFDLGIATLYPRPGML